ncbi:unnamed protein product [marine sediment metagenome]|uniref:Uncharacterized protein n=1 Tax=marine sediment metagenome TaxID=412755 RepID=X1N1A8_9ZZZZ
MANLITPELVLQVAEATEDYVVTPTEFSEIMGTVTSIFVGVAVAGFVGMLTGAIIKRFTKETGVSAKKIAGVVIPIL